MEEYDDLIKELEELKIEHKSICEMIERNISNSSSESLALQKMKKRKLAVKDRIMYIESIIYPDIIA